MRDSDEVALHACRPAVDVSKKLCTGHVSSNTAQCECLKRRMRGKMGRPAATSSLRHRLSSFLLATRVKENFKFWLRWQSDRSWSQGKGNPPFSLV